MDVRPNLMPLDGFRGGAPFRGTLVEHAGESGPSTLAWVIFALVLVLLLLAIVSLAIDAYYRSRGSRPAPAKASGGGTTEALTTLDARYARGEVSREDYLRTRDDLRGTDDATTQVMPAGPEPEPA